MHKHRAMFVGAIVLTAVPALAQQIPAGESAKPVVSAAWLDLERITQSSAEGKIATAKMQALSQKKGNEIADRTKELQDSQKKLQAGGTVLNEAARVRLERDVERLTIDIQRMQQDAQAEVEELRAELQTEFQQKLLPVIERVVKERNIDFLFSRIEAGIVFASPTLDLTDEVIRRFDATTAAPVTSKPAGTAPAAAPPATPPPGK